MTPRRFYELYNCIYLHKKGRYDCIKYQFTFKSTEESFFKHKGKWHFQKWSKKYNNEDKAIDFIFSNVFFGNEWIGSFTEENYLKLTGQRENLEYYFSEKLKNIFEEGMKNYIQRIIDTQDISETVFFTLLNNISRNKFLEKLKITFSDNILFDEFQKNVLTLTPFLDRFYKIDSGTKKELLKKLTNH